jgi:hypothetical protein
MHKVIMDYDLVQHMVEIVQRQWVLILLNMFYFGMQYINIKVDFGRPRLLDQEA